VITEAALEAVATGARTAAAPGIAEPEFFTISSPRLPFARHLGASIWGARGANPVKEWTKGTWLLPCSALDEPEAALRSRLCRAGSAAYPPRGDGKTLFPFRRLFMSQPRRKAAARTGGAHRRTGRCKQFGPAA
jgi:hypothetical protein